MIYSSITATINKHYPEVATTLELLDIRCKRVHWTEVCSEIDGYLSRFNYLKEHNGESVCKEFITLYSSLSDLKLSVAVVNNYFTSLLQFFDEKGQDYTIDSFLSHFHYFYTSFISLSSEDTVSHKYSVEDVLSVDSNDTSDSNDFSSVCCLLS